MKEYPARQTRINRAALIVAIALVAAPIVFGASFGYARYARTRAAFARAARTIDDQSSRGQVDVATQTRAS